MTAAPSDLRDALADPNVRRRLVAIVGRRVPPDATEDVVQSVLCDALAAREVPTESLPRWLYAIARHKVADFHRRAKLRTRETAGEEATRDPLEERDLLERAQAIAPDRRALEWIVRAETGVSLAEIAREEELPAPVVRQRVSRLRRALRTALLAAAALAVVLAVSARRAPVDTIRSDRAAAPSLDGRWHVVRAACAAGAPPACAGAVGTHVRISGDAATIELTRGAVVLDVGDTLREYHAQTRAVGATLRIECDLGVVTLARD
jgi:DNA-directed RNA polymerase specialized sigma24 family protein